MPKFLKWGSGAAFLLLGVYFSILTLISGWGFALDQFRQFWYFILTLAGGFGLQVGLYAYLRELVRGGNGSGKVLAVSGTTSTTAMISCCAHYLANILPIIGVSGAIALIGQYQIEIFWVGLAFNAAGIIYIARKVIAFHRK